MEVINKEQRKYGKKKKRNIKRKYWKKKGKEKRGNKGKNGKRMKIQINFDNSQGIMKPRQPTKGTL